MRSESQRSMHSKRTGSPKRKRKLVGDSFIDDLHKKVKLQTLQEKSKIDSSRGNSTRMFRKNKGSKKFLVSLNGNLSKLTPERQRNKTTFAQYNTFSEQRKPVSHKDSLIKKFKMKPKEQNVYISRE